MDIAKVIMFLFLCPVFILLPVWLGRRKHVPSFDYWIETEGAPILGAVLILAIALLAFPLGLIGLLFLYFFNRWMK